MSTLLLPLVLLVALPPTSAPDPVAVWNQLALTSVRAKRASDAEVARLLAMMNVAMYDAVNAIESADACAEDQRKAALVPARGAPSRASPPAAAAAAAHAVLTAAYPDLAAGFAQQLEADLAAAKPGSGTGRVNAGRSWGAFVGAQVLAARANDHSSPAETQPPGSGPGKFSSAWGGVQYRNLTPFAVRNPADFVTPGPPDLASLDYAAAFAEVKLLGNAAIADETKRTVFQYWSLAAGTVQPPGEWVKIALNEAVGGPLPLVTKTRLLALLTMALADTVAPTVTTKFSYGHWRPQNAIREAASDGNPYTDPDPGWAPRAGGAGTSPEHTSGHSAFSAAAAGVLVGFFCSDDMPFSHVSDSSPGGLPRQFASFSAAAAEAGRSRVLGGIHFEFSNQAGLAAGRAVAEEVLARALLRRRGPTHHGQCPL